MRGKVCRNCNRLRLSCLFVCKSYISENSCRTAVFSFNSVMKSTRLTGNNGLPISRCFLNNTECHSPGWLYSEAEDPTEITVAAVLWAGFHHNERGWAGADGVGDSEKFLLFRMRRRQVKTSIGPASASNPTNPIQQIQQIKLLGWR